MEGLLSAGIRRDPRSTQLLWKTLDPNTNVKMSKSFSHSKISLSLKVRRSFGLFFSIYLVFNNNFLKVRVSHE